MTEQQLVDFFDGKATAFEKQHLETWVTDPDNQELFYETLARWEHRHPQFVPDTNQALTRHYARLNARHQPGSALAARPTFTTHRTAGWMPLLRAASVAVVLLVATGWWFREALLNQTCQTAYGQTKPIRLPDGSRVVLNANSRLTWPRWGFGRASRTVQLTGEARFSVVHKTDNQPFVVKAGPLLDVLVLGTEFTVYARPRGARVVLIRGRVQLRYHQNNRPTQRILRPGQLVMLAPGGRLTQQTTPHPGQHAAWTQHRYVFDQTPLSELAVLFAEQFGLQIEIPDPAVAHWTVSGSFTAYTADELLETLAETANLRYKKTGTHVVLLPIP